MLSDEKLKMLDEFFRNVDENVAPYFLQFGYTRKTWNGRIITFEKRTRNRLLSSIDYFSFLKQGIKAFCVDFSFSYKFPYRIRMRREKTDNWHYHDQDDLKEKLGQTLKIIREKKMLETIDSELENCSPEHFPLLLLKDTVENE